MLWSVSDEGVRRQRCADCGKTDYPQHDVAVGAIVERDGRVLLIERAREPFKGTWCLPSGFLEITEDPASGAARELFEETGVRALELELFGVYRSTDDPRGIQLLIVQRVLRFAGEPATSSEATRVGFFTADALPSLAGGGIPAAMRDWARRALSR